MYNQERPYNHDSTASRLLSEVKHDLARLVLRWGTTLESLVLFFLHLHIPKLLSTLQYTTSCSYFDIFLSNTTIIILSSILSCYHAVDETVHAFDGAYHRPRSINQYNINVIDLTLSSSNSRLVIIVTDLFCLLSLLASTRCVYRSIFHPLLVGTTIQS